MVAIIRASEVMIPIIGEAAHQPRLAFLLPFQTLPALFFESRNTAVLRIGCVYQHCIGLDVPSLHQEC